MSQRLLEPPLSLLQEGALLLDFDGTLVELAETPDAIRIPAELPGLIERLSRRVAGGGGGGTRPRARPLARRPRAPSRPAADRARRFARRRDPSRRRGAGAGRSRRPCGREGSPGAL